MKIRSFFRNSIWGSLLLFSIQAFSQDAGLGSVTSALQQYQNNVLQEKIFFHSDKSAYLAGEVMWFKVYNVEGTNHHPLDISKVTYVEVLDKEQTQVAQVKIAMSDGNGNGTLLLPTSLNSGSYLIRAYTSWMKNFSPDLYFVKPITIVNTFKPLVLEPKSKATDYDIQFFPEGGHLVNNLQSTVAFKAVDTYGKGINFSGAVLDQRNDTVATFKTHQFGIGRFVLKPEAGKKYRAILKSEQGQIVTRYLPEAQERGAVMHLSSKGTDELQLTVQTSAAPPAAGLYNLYLLVHTRGEAKIAEAKQPDEAGVVSFNISKSALGDGISHFTIFNANKQPICERLYFRKPEKVLQINAVSDQAQYGLRSKVDLSLQTKSLAGKFEAADLSVAVYKLDSLNTTAPQSFESYLWLTSDLKGNIESPDYYFSSKGSELLMDNLMLTHGWSRFKWDDILAKPVQTFTYLPEYGGHLVHGRVLDSRTKAPATGIAAYLASPSRAVSLYTSVSNEKGDILFDMKNLYGPQTLILQTNTSNDSSYSIEIGNPFSTEQSNVTFPYFSLSDKLKGQLQTSSIHLQVQNFHTPFSSYPLKAASFDSTAFYGSTDKTYQLDDYTRFPVMEEVMREYVAPVFVRKRQGKFHFYVVDQPRKAPFEAEPLILLDGVPVFDTDKIMAFDPRKIQLLDVISRRYYIGTSTFSGVVSYVTYAGDLAGFEVDPKALMMEYEGLQKQREFYSPQYNTPGQLSSRLPDLRSLLYWNPNIQTSAEGKYYTQFYTSDVAGTYMVVVHGLTMDGKAGTGIHTFNVKQKEAL